MSERKYVCARQYFTYSKRNFRYVLPCVKVRSFVQLSEQIAIMLTQCLNECFAHSMCCQPLLGLTIFTNFAHWVSEIVIMVEIAF